MSLNNVLSLVNYQAAKKILSFITERQELIDDGVNQLFLQIKKIGLKKSSVLWELIAYQWDIYNIASRGPSKEILSWLAMKKYNYPKSG